MGIGTHGEQRDGHAASPIPDIEGKDVLQTEDPIAQARGLASALEAENTERIQKLINLGVHPTVLQISAIQVRLEELIKLIPMPDQLRAQFEVVYEAAVAEFLDKAAEEITKPKIHVAHELHHPEG